MLKSMTGYGSAQGASGKLDITVEVKSVNSRFLENAVRLPRIYAFAEDKIKALVQKHVARGKVDVYVTIDNSKADDTVIRINEPLADAYFKAIQSLSERYGLKNDLSPVQLSRYPDVLTVEKAEADADVVAADICAVLEQALEAFNAMRAREGERLKADMLAHLDEIERLTGLCEARSPITVAEYRQRLTQKMQDILEDKNIDEARLLTEAAIFADRVAINEETVRLRSHIAQMRSMLEEGIPVGRKLDFLIQEFNRESNTIGSKGNDLEMAKYVVDLKGEIEKIREQVQNVE